MSGNFRKRYARSSKRRFYQAFDEHTEELRRTLGISTSFYEKLATLDAASIAVAASAAVGIVAKLILAHAALKALVIWLIVTTRVVWGEPLEGSSRFILAEVEDDASSEDMSTLSQAKRFLMDSLAYQVRRPYMSSRRESVRMPVVKPAVSCFTRQSHIINNALGDEPGHLYW
jgi:hypothetical protein